MSDDPPPPRRPLHSWMSTTQTPPNEEAYVVKSTSSSADDTPVKGLRASASRRSAASAVAARPFLEMAKSILLMSACLMVAFVSVLWVWYEAIAKNMVDPVTGVGNAPFLLVHELLYATLGICLAWVVSWYIVHDFDDVHMALLSLSVFPFAFVLRYVYVQSLSGYNWLECTFWGDVGGRVLLNMVSLVIVVSFPFAMAWKSRWSTANFLRFALALTAIAAAWLIMLSLLDAYFDGAASTKVLLRVVVVPLFVELVLSVVKQIEINVDAVGQTMLLAQMGAIVGRLMMVPTGTDPLLDALLPIIVGAQEVILRISYFRRHEFFGWMLGKLNVVEQRNKEDIHDKHSFLLVMEMILELVTIVVVHVMAVLFSAPQYVSDVVNVPKLPSATVATISCLTQLGIEVVVDGTCLLLERKQGIKLEDGWNAFYSRKLVGVTMTFCISACLLSLHAFVDFPKICNIQRGVYDVFTRLPLVFWLIMLVPAYHTYDYLNRRRAPALTLVDTSKQGTPSVELEALDTLVAEGEGVNDE